MRAGCGNEGNCFLFPPPHFCSLHGVGRRRGSPFRFPTSKVGEEGKHCIILRSSFVAGQSEEGMAIRLMGFHASGCLVGEDAPLCTTRV